jgi:hypothetical protein
MHAHLKRNLHSPHSMLGAVTPRVRPGLEGCTRLMRETGFTHFLNAARSGMRT